MKRIGSGKTKGATSFVTVRLADLNGILRENAEVVISRKFAETLSLKGRAFEATPASHDDVGSQIKFTVTEKLD